MNGEAFINLSREDLAIVFNQPAQFILASKLYKIVQKAREESTQDLLDELSQLEKDTPWSGSQSIASSTTTSTPSSSKSSAPFGTRRKRSNTDLSSNAGSMKCAKVTENFQLPFFSPVIQECIKKDAFYTTSQRNKLIREACTSLRGFCCGKGETVTMERKRELARMLLKLAPKSLKDPEKEGSHSKCASPEVSGVCIIVYIHVDCNVNVLMFSVVMLKRLLLNKVLSWTIFM